MKNSIFIEAGRNIVASFFAVAISVGLFLVAGGAVAGETVNGGRELTVKFQDLDISKPAGAAALYGRIHVAAESVCQAPDQSLVNYSRHNKCAKEAEINAISKVNAPALTAYYEQKTGGKVTTLSANLMK